MSDICAVGPARSASRCDCRIDEFDFAPAAERGAGAPKTAKG